MVTTLIRRGYDAQELDLDGHRPDIRVGNDYLDVKTNQLNQKNLAIEVNSLHAYWRIQHKEGRRVYIVHCIPLKETWDMWVMVPESVRIKKGPIRPSSGDNSNDDWHLCEPGNRSGTPFDLFFYPKAGSIESMEGRG